MLPLLAAGLLPVGATATKNVRPTAPTASPTARPVASDKGDAVALDTRDKIHLAGTFFPVSKSGKAPGVVLVHDAGADRSSLANLAEYLQKKGVNVLTVDLRGHGESATKDLAWTSLADERARAGLWSFAAIDVRTAVDWLREQDNVHSARVGVVGIGIGGSLALSEALDDRDTSAVALIAPVAENHGYNLSRSLSDLAGLPTLILAPKDARSDAERLQTSAHSANGGEPYVTVTTLKTESGSTLEDKRLGSELAKWLKATLEPDN
jgi:dienelactone hydrolase